MELVNGAIDKLASGFKTAKDHIVEFIRSVTGIESIGDLLSTISSKVSDFFSGVAERMKGSGDTISSVGDTIKKVAEKIWESLKKVFGWISENVSIGDVFAGLAGGGIFVAAKKFSDLIEKIKDAIENLFGSKGDSGIKGKFAEIGNNSAPTPRIIPPVSITRNPPYLSTKTPIINWFTAYKYMKIAPNAVIYGALTANSC